MNYKPYHWCAVPECKNTSLLTPEKLWFQMPTDLQMRKIWFKLSKRDPKLLSKNCPLYFCDDHFDLKRDMLNYMEYKLMGSVKKVQLKPNRKPSRFLCRKKYVFPLKEANLVLADALKLSSPKGAVQDNMKKNKNISLPSCSKDSQMPDVMASDKASSVTQVEAHSSTNIELELVKMEPETENENPHEAGTQLLNMGEYLKFKSMNEEVSIKEEVF